VKNEKVGGQETHHQSESQLPPNSSQFLAQLRGVWSRSGVLLTHTHFSDDSPSTGTCRINGHKTVGYSSEEFAS